MNFNKIVKLKTVSVLSFDTFLQQFIEIIVNKVCEIEGKPK